MEELKQEIKLKEKETHQNKKDIEKVIRAEISSRLVVSPFMMQTIPKLL